MGMDYRFAGSASYPRFSEELTKVAALFNIAKVSAEPVEGTINYWMGCDVCSNKKDRYLFPEGTPKAIKTFFDTPFEKLTLRETKEVYNFLKRKLVKVREISHQIIYELECCVKEKRCWEIY